MVALPQISISTDMSEGLCFGCGQNNPIGLKLDFEWDGKTARTEFTPQRLYQGWPGVVHGGIITCMLDEAMSYAARFEGNECLTTHIEIKFRRPAPVKETLIVVSSVTRHTRKLIETKAQVSSGDGTVIAEARAKHFVIETKSDNAVKKEESRSDA
ncbi:PaaI family thioesterase [Chloroflexota bacterium]